MELTELVQAIRNRQITSRELVEGHLETIGRLNPLLNAVVTLDEAAARARADAADAALATGEVWGALHGIPFTIKDAYATAGMRTTGGYPPLAEYVPDRDATVVERLKSSGGILLGKTNVPPLSADHQTVNPLFGRTVNPWDPERTPGGSTGGGAAALAVGMTPFEVGSDIAGSVRIPAHFCGVYGLKPTERRIPLSGHIPQLPGAPRGRYMNTAGPLTRSIADLRLLLSLLAGPDDRDWEVPPVPVASAQTRELGGLRVALSTAWPGVPTSGETRQAIDSLARTLSDQGCVVQVDGPIPFDPPHVWQMWAFLSAAQRSASDPRPLEERLAAVQAHVDAEDPFLRGFARGGRASLADVARALADRDALIGNTERWLADYDVWVCPVTPAPAHPHSEHGTPVAVDDALVSYYVAGLSYTCPINVTSQPAVVIPLGLSSSGLPIGAQLIARRWAEAELLDVAQAIDTAIGGYCVPPLAL